MTISTVLSANAWPMLSAPGRPSSRSIATGTVGASARAITIVAPNSPTEMAKAKPAATSRARRTSGRSTSRQARHGEAPNVAAASRRRGSIDRSTGVMVRTTKGSATTAWATGTSHGLARRSTGSSRASRKPKPTVTADVPSGRSSKASRAPAARLVARARAAAAHPPSATAMTVATRANRSEFATASVGATKSPAPGSASARQADRPKPSPVRKERSTSTTSGVTSRTAIPARLASNQARWPGVDARRRPPGRSATAARARRRSRRSCTTSSAPTAPSCSRASTEATGRSSRPAVCR